MNKDLTGDTTEFSEQFYVNCRPNGISGCAGGVSNDGFKQTMKQQYLMSAEFLPYTADCKFRGRGGEGYIPHLVYSSTIYHPLSA